ncbi:MAG: hypothetical protein ACR2JU_07405 [Nocardioidaceae bacterium]
MNLRRALAAVALGGLGSVAACSGGSVGSSPPAPTPVQPPTAWVVSLGDSYISGEGDRWAGNTTQDFGNVDALGPSAYTGPGGLEEIPGCHRADLPEVAVDTGSVAGKNLACSGAETSSKTEGVLFKPGIDFYQNGRRVGQALALERFARHHPVTAVVLSIGGNDFHFSTILTRCVLDFFLTAGQPRPYYCSDDGGLAPYFTAAHVAEVRTRIRAAVDNIATAMRRAGSTPSDYRLIVQGYPSPVPPGGRFRYPQTSAGRFDLGSCPLFNRDASWADATVLTTINDTVRRAARASGLPNVTFLDMSQAFVGHRLCERGAAQLQESGLASWRSPGAANALEWVNQIYLKGAPWEIQESAHPNYWGTAAERNCLRQVVASTTSASVACVRDGTAMVGREPAMKLVGD